MNKNFIYLLILIPTFTEYIESGHFPDSQRELITDIVMTAVTIILVIMFNTRCRYVEHLSLHDHLTGIGNRRIFDLDLKREVLRSKRINSCIGLIFFDIDGFKDFNDKFGHQKGDDLLIAFAKSLTDFSRKGTDYCYRFGGDEFAILLTGIHADEMSYLTNKIENRLENTVYKKLPNGVSASKGFVLLNEDETYKQFLKRADDAMYEAKLNRKSKLQLS